MPLRRMIRPLAFACAAALGLQACSTYNVVSVATSKNPAEAARRLAAARAASYERNPLLLAKDLTAARRHFEQLVAVLRGEAGKTWGEKGVLLPGNKKYVKYTQNYLSRAVVQFETGEITVETLDQKSPDTSLRNAIVTTLLTPDDPRAVDLYSAKGIELSGRPYLYGLVADEKGNLIGDPAQAESFADWLVRERKELRNVPTGEGDKQASVVRFRMVSDYSNRQAQRYAAEVERQSKRFGVSKSLIYAVIKTESAFNPYAVSSAPAYGLMQLVPGTGGRDAYKYVKGTDYTPTREYLFEPANNIELGTAYLNLIESQYLGQIADPVTREYCTIAAYNGGAGNVLNLFSKDRARAPDAINALPPSQVYLKLRDEHPREETRRYLIKVLDARKQFSGGGPAT